MWIQNVLAMHDFVGYALRETGYAIAEVIITDQKPLLGALTLKEETFKFATKEVDLMLQIKS